MQDLGLILEKTAPLWEQAKGAQLFLTGGTGFFGCWLVESFCYINRELGLNTRMTVLTRNPSAFSEKCPHLVSDPALTLYQGDVRNFSFPEGEFNHIIHAATETYARGSGSAPLDTFSTIVAGTERALQFARASGAPNFLLISSGAVYGKQPTDIANVPETYFGAPDLVSGGSVYGEGKRAAELLGALYQEAGGPECRIARCWAFCGPHLPLDRHFAIGNFIGDVLAGRSISIQGDGTQRRSYMYAADLAIWLWTILFRAPALVPINVGSDHDVSILELARTVAATLNPQTEIHLARKAVPGAPPLRYVPCVNRARELLKLEVTIDLAESIRRTAQWHRDEPH